MKIIKFLPLVLVVSGVAYGAVRGDSSARVGVGGRGSQAGARMSVSAADVQQAQNQSAQTSQASKDVVQSVPKVESSEKTNGVSGNCRDAYRECMDSFCLLEESQGERCACSDNINAAKSKIKAVLDIQAEADKLFTEGVERENWVPRLDLCLRTIIPARRFQVRILCLG